MYQQRAAAAVPDQQGSLSDQQTYPAPQPIRNAEVPALGHGDATPGNQTGQQNPGIRTRQLQAHARTPVQGGEGDLVEDPASVSGGAEPVDEIVIGGTDHAVRDQRSVNKFL